MTHADLYVACATVIPVLLLTESLQASLYRRYAEQVGKPLLQGRHRRPARIGRWLAIAMAAISVLLALSGEAAAIIALAGDHDTPTYRASAAWSTLLLLLLVGVAVFVEMVVQINRPKADDV